ncbi:Hydroxyacyl-coenzyme A dehydrogenase [Blattella germanica]|nr:Hydroxyacyl-coenzyme A dehydrogenase [Blattella germanica]
MALPFATLNRYFSSSTTMSSVIKHVTIIGGGLMGSGIAQVAAQVGNTATIVDLNEASLKKAQNDIKISLQRIAKKLFKEKPNDGEKFVHDVLSRITTTEDMTSAVKNADLVLEAVTENLELKQKLFSKLDKIAPEHTIFASNTSSLSIQEIAADTGRKDRFGGLHFFSPVPMMKLLEVIRIPETSDNTYEKMIAWGKEIGKTTITCKDTPGFVVNRLLVPILAEAVRMLERGDATARDIDTAMKLGAGYPMGPFELADFSGIDTPKYILDGELEEDINGDIGMEEEENVSIMVKEEQENISRIEVELAILVDKIKLGKAAGYDDVMPEMIKWGGWHKKFPDQPLFKPIPLLNKLVEEGKVGMKAGEGFYKYDKSK